MPDDTQWRWRARAKALRAMLESADTDVMTWAGEEITEMTRTVLELNRPLFNNKMWIAINALLAQWSGAKHVPGSGGKEAIVEHILSNPDLYGPVSLNMAREIADFINWDPTPGPVKDLGGDLPKKPD